MSLEWCGFQILEVITDNVDDGGMKLVFIVGYIMSTKLFITDVFSLVFSTLTDIGSCGVSVSGSKYVLSLRSYGGGHHMLI